MRPLAQWNPIVIGLLSLTTIVTLLLLAYHVDELPLLGAGTRYSAEFSESAGWSPTTRFGWPESRSAK